MHNGVVIEVDGLKHEKSAFNAFVLLYLYTDGIQNTMMSM